MTGIILATLVSSVFITKYCVISWLSKQLTYFLFSERHISRFVQQTYNLWKNIWWVSITFRFENLISVNIGSVEQLSCIKIKPKLIFLFTTSQNCHIKYDRAASVISINILYGEYFRKYKEIFPRTSLCYVQSDVLRNVLYTSALN